jgi:hypothetical protein
MLRWKIYKISYSMMMEKHEYHNLIRELKEKND